MNKKIKILKKIKHITTQTQQIKSIFSLIVCNYFFQKTKSLPRRQINVESIFNGNRVKC